MATPKKKPAKHAAKPATKAEKTEAAHPGVNAAPSPAPRGLNDVRGDEAPVLGQFVEVASGDDKGRYGVFMETAADDNAVVRTRDSASERIVVPISDLRPAPAGLR